MTARRRTTLNLDTELLAEAQCVLGTTQATETIHRALQEVVDREKRRRLVAMGVGDLTPDSLTESRRNRTFDSSDALQPA